MKNVSKFNPAITLAVHTKVRGDANSAQQKLLEKNQLGKVLNEEVKTEFKYLPVTDLIPLDTQRDTNVKWVVDRQIDLKGFDVLACGPLNVALDPNDRQYYVFDGCGRLAQAQINGAPAVLPCWIAEIPKERAAFYFAYNQDRGRRSLTKEVLFVNRWYSNEAEALKEAQYLSQIGCRIRGSQDFQVPKNSQDPAIKYRALSEGLKISCGNISLMRLARDMIYNAWSTQKSGADEIRLDLFLGLIFFLQKFPDFQSKTKEIHKSFQTFLNVTASLTPQSKLSWLKKGGNVRNYEWKSVAIGMGLDFRDSQQWKPGFQNFLTKRELDDMRNSMSVDDTE